MTFDDYQKAAVATAIYPDDLKLIYPAIGLAGETGEVMEHIKKTIRDNNRQLTEDRRHALAKELGDVLWYMANLAEDAGLSLADIARQNIEKVNSRKARGVQPATGV
jgi:NTP pyrophosphatase (non-canonical NTP hydrolase)